MNLRAKIAEVDLLVFDFDGTLVDSNAIKINAFAKCFSEYEDRLEDIMSYCRENHHTSRFEKCRHVFTHILKLPYTKDLEKKLLTRYENETTEQVIAASEIAGALAFVAKSAERGPLAILSSTPHDVLLTLLKKRRIDPYFQVIQGSPVIKADWLGRLEKTALFFGDTKEDRCAAEKAGVPFVGVANQALKERGYYIESFEELL